MTLQRLIKELQEAGGKASNVGDIWVASSQGDAEKVKHVYVDGEGDIVIVTKKARL